MTPIRPPEALAVLCTGLALLLFAGCHEDDCLGHDCEPHDHADTTTMDAAADTSDGAAALCQCLLLLCHTDFHTRYGATDDEAIPACQTDAATFDAGALECRQTACNASDCASALGGGTCSAP